MNFLNVIHYPIFGGPHNRACRLNEPLDRRGFKTLVLLPQEAGTGSERLKKAGVPIVKIPLHRARSTFSVTTHFFFFKGFLGEVNAIRNLIRKQKTNFVLISGLVNMHGALAGYLERIPVVWQITDSRTPVLLRLVMLPFVKKLSNSVMFNGDRLIRFHFNRFSFKIPHFVYYPPVDTTRFQNSKKNYQSIRQKLGVQQDDSIVGMVANLNPQKGIEYFIRAASLIHNVMPNCFFLIIGALYKTHNKYYKFIEDEIAKSTVPRRRFIFTGDIDDVEEYYPLMDVKLITSVPRSEGTTTTAIEAMACGIPIVAHEVGSIGEIVENGRTGFLVPPFDIKAVAHAVLCLLQDYGLRKRMGAEARRKAVESYEVEICADTHVRAFKAAIENHCLNVSN